MTLTDGTPLDSVNTVSWRPHAVQDPQSATACTTTSHSEVNESSVSAMLPPMALSQFFCWTTIAMEFSIAAGLAVPRLYRLGIWLALLFHFSAVAMTVRSLQWARIA